MAANMVRNLHNALKQRPIVSTTVWIDSGRPVLDQKSGKTLESFRIKPSQEDGGNYQRDRDQLEVLSNREEFGRPGKQRSWSSQDGDRRVVYRS